MENILQIENLHVKAEGKEILKGIDLQIKKGETHVIMGPNGSGKTTTANAILNNPTYKKEQGTIIFNKFLKICKKQNNRKTNKNIWI